MLFKKKHIISSLNSDKISEYIEFKKKHNPSGKLCHAPFTSLRFTISGNIQACCFNRLLVLGKYPENNLIDVWNGEKIKLLKDSILNNDLGMGCGYCSEAILKGNYRSTGSVNYDYIKLTDSNWPVMFDFELGNNCNLECIMCNGENSALIRQNREKEKPYCPPYDDEFVKQLEPFILHLSEARFVGGEPFLIEINYKIWEKIIEINPSCAITVLTNGTVLNERIRSLLSKGNFNISVSADGISPEVYEKIRINADYNVFMKNLQFFIDYTTSKKNPFLWNFCPQRLNRYEIPDIFSFCNNSNINLILHTIIFPPQTALWNLPESELVDIKSDLLKSQPVFNKFNKVHNKNFELYRSLIKQIDDWIATANKTENADVSDSQELKTQLYSKISSYILESKVFSDLHKNDLIELYIRKLDEILKLLDKKSLNKVLTFMISFNIEFIIAEIAYSSDEKLKQRILTITN
ncbi:MAG: radical SAM protein [Bacteroidota bacterium]